MKKLLLIVLLAIGSITLIAAKPADAATVWCNAHAPNGTYVAYLFRTGDRLPTAVTTPFTIDGGKIVGWTGVSTGHWFIRVVEADGNYNLSGQTNDGYLRSYYSTPLNLGDCWISP